MTMFRHGGALRGLGGRSYVKRIGAIFGSSIVAFWPQNESAGTVSKDISGHAYNGAYTGVTLGAAGIGDGNTAASFDGTTSFNNVYSAGVAGAINFTEFSVMGWAKVTNSGVWTDATNRVLAIFFVDASNQIFIRKTTTNHQIRGSWVAGGNTANVNHTFSGVGPTSYFHWALTASKTNNRMRFYIQGVQTGTDQTQAGTFAGTLAQAYLGVSSGGASLFWSGSKACDLLLNREATAAEIAQAATV